MMKKGEIGELLQSQKDFFFTGVTTHFINGRIKRANALADLRAAIYK